ncbi:MAG: galactose oxidase-like domain-containing protein, partial [Myxococcaceae bacterium]
MKRYNSKAGRFVGLLVGMLAGAAAWGQPAVVGEWTEPFPWMDNATHATLLHTGKVLTWNEFEPDEFHLWDPASGASTLAAAPGYNVFCTGHALLADGRVLVSGGSLGTNRGMPNASIYDPTLDTWTRLPDMNDGRWYPTNTPLPNGDMLVTAGTVNQRRLGENRLPQVWQTSLGTWRDLTGALRTVEQYPMMFLAPDGRVFMAGPGPMSAYLDTSGTGAWTEVGPRAAGECISGSAVMYEDGKILVSGGGEDFPTDAVEVIDLNSPAPTWRTVQPMGQPRKQHNMTLLPDGTVLVTGGSSGPGKDDVNNPVLPTELWDPATERFTVLASSSRFRGYHSTALLLPDGRVLSTGGQQSEDDAQIFSPPYLFKGPRPTLGAAPPRVAYGETFTVSTPDAASITRVTWLRLGSVTHAFNQNQRINRLAFTREAGGLRVTAPANSNLAPPGDHLLFILNDQGVPSVGAWIKVGGPDTAPAVEVAAVGFGEVWKYDDRGVDPGEGWTQTAFDDSRWKIGPGSFATNGQAGTLLQLQDGQPTVYFRKKLRLTGAALGGKLKVQHDDGVEVWLNGTLLLSRNIETGADHEAYAEAGGEAAQVSEATLPVGLLVEGDNQLAVRVKRVKPTTAQPSPELRFDLELAVSVRGEVGPVPILALSAPNGGEVLEARSTFPVAWVTHGALPTVRLEYSMNGGSSWHVIETAVANTGRYDWRVPELGSAEMLLRVAGGNESASADLSDSLFTVVTSPGTPVAPDDPETCSDCSRDGSKKGAQGCTTAGPVSSVFGLLAALGWAVGRRRGRAPGA